MPTPAPAPAAPAQPVAAWNPEGELVQIPAFDLAAQVQGYRLASPQEVTSWQAEQKYGGFGEGAKAFGEGALSALTFGAGPALEQALGVKPEDIAGRKEAHPIAHGAGEVAGVAAPLILTAGASGPASAAAAGVEGAEAAAGATRAAPGILDTLRGAAEFTGPGLIGKAGQAARAGVEAAGMEGLAGRTLPLVAQGAVEGGLYAGADLAERHYLRDPGLTAESAAMELGIGSLFGGGLMGLGKLAGEGFSALLGKASKGLQSLSEGLASGDKATVRLMMENRGTLSALEEAAPGAVEQVQASSPATAEWIFKNAKEIAKREAEFPGVTKLLARADPETAQLVLDNWGKLLKDPQRRIEVGLAQGKALQETYSTVENALRTTNRSVRPAEIERLTAGVSGEAAGAEYGRIFDAVDELATTMRSQPELYPAMYPKKLEMIRDGMVRDVGDMSAQSRVFHALDDIKGFLDGPAKFGKMVPPDHVDAVNALKGLRSEIKTSLENTAVWGEAGERQAAFNAAQNRYLTAKKQLEKTLMQKVTTRTGAVTFEVAPTKVNSWINLMADARGQAKSKVFDEYVEAARSLAGEMERSGYGEAGAVRQLVDAAAASSEDVRRRANVTQIVKMLQGHEILSSGPAIPNVGQELAQEALHRAGAKVLPFGLTGMITGTIDKLRSPSTTIGVLNALDKMAQKTSKAIGSGVGRIFEGEAAAASGAAARSVTPETYPNVSADLHHLGGDLDALADKVAQHTHSIDDHAPASADALRALAARTAHHLASVVPVGPPKLPLSPEYRPSVAELVPLNRAHEVAQNPLRVLDRVARGTLDRQHVAALDAIWPKLAQEMRTQTLEQLAAHTAAGKTVPRRSRLALTMFLGTDLDRSTTQATIAANQAAFAGAQKPQVPGAIGQDEPGGKGGGKASAIKAPQAFATASQRQQGRDIA